MAVVRYDMVLIPFDFIFANMIFDKNETDLFCDIT